jgi:hypothetical protein
MPYFRVTPGKFESSVDPETARTDKLSLNWYFNPSLFVSASLTRHDLVYGSSIFDKLTFLFLRRQWDAQHEVDVEAFTPSG